MSLHLIKAINHVIEEYCVYLVTYVDYYFSTPISGDKVPNRRGLSRHERLAYERKVL